MYIRADVNHVTQRAWFDLVHGAVGTHPADWTAQIAPPVNGWYRCSVTFTVPSIQNASLGATGFGLAPGDNQSSYVGSYSNGVYEFGQQFESGSLSDYLPNVGPCMEFTKAADATSVTAGSPIGYWMYLRNVASAGGGAPAVATSATINDPLPVGTGLNWSVSPAYTGPGTCTITGAPGNQTLACALGNLAANAAALVSVHVTSSTTAANCGSQPNTATAAAINYTPGRTAFATTAVTCTSPSLSISKTHTGELHAGAERGDYTVTVSNAGPPVPTSGTVTVTETVPTGLTLVSMAGTGWTCPGTSANNCTRSDVLAAGASYPPITVTVNVAANAPAPVTNQVSVSGGGSAVANASDPTTIGGIGGFTPIRVNLGGPAYGQWAGDSGCQGETHTP